MKKLLDFLILHRTVIIISTAAFIATATCVTAVFIFESSKKERDAISSVTNISSQGYNPPIYSSSTESDTNSSSSSDAALNLNIIPKEETEIKPSTGSVLTAPEFSYKEEEDVLNEEVNPNKFGPQAPSNTVNPNVKKIEPTDVDVNVRADAGTKFTSLGKVSIGEIFDYLGEKVGTDGMIWYNISGIIGGKQQSGYIRSDYAKYKDEAPKPADTFKFEQKDGKTYCYKNGELLKGYADVNGLRYYFNKETGEKESYTCIDVSKYQKNINWSKVKESGVEYAIIRVGFRGYGEKGTLSIDPYFEQNIKGAKAAGIKCGVYFYSAAKNIIEAVEEANFVLNAVKGYSLDLPIAFDTELVGERLSGVSAKQRTDNAIAFMETVKQAGYKTMLYTYFNFYNNYLEKSRLTDYTLWMAYYTDNSSLLNGISYDGWQYASDGSVSGIAGRCDMNVIFKSMITGNKNDNPLTEKVPEITPPVIIPPVSSEAVNSEDMSSELSSKDVSSLS